ncbi:MAG: Crp/Fnr family transcriptional regulator [Oscillospiraceae bacterium]|nr:Crp/Fnr family transcriptional regulator [Oscillospiraceae bacterium]
MEDWPALERCALLAGLPAEVVRQRLLPWGVLRQYPKNGALISVQERVDWFGILLTGRVQIVQQFSSGASSLMENLFPSYVLGLDLICTKSRRSPYCALAAAPVQVLIFPDEALMEPGGLPEAERMLVWKNLLTLLAQENMRKHSRLAVLAQRGLRDRILTYLTMQAGRRGACQFQIPFTRDELADYLCVNRSALSHELSLMRQEGLIRFRKNEFTLLPAGEDQSNWSVIK